MKRFEGVFIGNGSNPISRRKKVANFDKIWRENRSPRAPRFRSGPMHLGQRSLCVIRSFCSTGSRSLQISLVASGASRAVAAHSSAVVGRLHICSTIFLGAGRYRCSGR